MKPYLPALLCTLLLAVYVFALPSAGDTGSHGTDSHGHALRGREFNGVVRAIEDHYGVRHTHIPFLSLAALFARPAGVRGLKLAVFEDFHPLSADLSSTHVATARATAHTKLSMTEDLQGVVEHSLGSDWSLFVRTRSHDDGDNTLIYVNLGDGKMQMMIVSIEPSEATVVEMNLNEQAMLRWIEKESAEEQAWHHHHRAED